MGFLIAYGILALAVLALARLIQGVPGDELAIWWLLFVGLLVLGVLVNLLALRKRLLADQRLRREKVASARMWIRTPTGRDLGTEDLIDGRPTFPMRQIERPAAESRW